MLAQTADSLKAGYTFTSNDGTTWHTVHDVMFFETAIVEPETFLVAITTNDHQKIWLWSTEDVVVRI